MRDFKDSPDFGRVITGSSNFSQLGLANNLEFNVELKNFADVQFALDKFEELWKESVEINQECIDTIENKTWIKSDGTPYEMYVKFLYEYFKEEMTLGDDVKNVYASKYLTCLPTKEELIKIIKDEKELIELAKENEKDNV